VEFINSTHNEINYRIIYKEQNNSYLTFQLNACVQIYFTVQ
jgi:hypothetical protein